MKYLSSGFGMNSCPYKKLSPKEKMEVYNQVYKILQDKFPNIVNEKHYKRLSQRGQIFYSKIHYKRMSGFYQHMTGDIHVEHIPFNQPLNRVLFHECIHKINKERFSRFRKGIVEGMTEDITEQCFGRKKSFINNSNIKLNFSSNTSYQYPVTLVRQMKYLLEEKDILEKSKLNGTLDFDKKFIKQFGLLLYEKMNYATTRLRFKNNQTLFLKTQDKLLKKAFNKKFKKCKKQEDYISRIELLKNFETLRGKDDNIDDHVFKDYYREKFEQLQDIFDKKGFDKQELLKHQYEEQDYYPVEEEIDYQKKEDFLLVHKIMDINNKYEDIESMKTCEVILYDKEKTKEEIGRYFLSIINNKVKLISTDKLKISLKLKVDDENNVQKKYFAITVDDKDNKDIARVYEDGSMQISNDYEIEQSNIIYSYEDIEYYKNNLRYESKELKDMQEEGISSIAYMAKQDMRAVINKAKKGISKILKKGKDNLSEAEYYAEEDSNYKESNKKERENLADKYKVNGNDELELSNEPKGDNTKIEIER